MLWLMARLLMCFGRAPNTWQLLVVTVTAFSMAWTSAALAFANGTAGKGRGGEREDMNLKSDLLLPAYFVHHPQTQIFSHAHISTLELPCLSDYTGKQMFPRGVTGTEGKTVQQL